jgi:RNA polymerase sigma-70 factor (ECF subfamily)
MSPEKQVEQKELAEAIHSFLAGLDEQKRNVFLARYWFMTPVKEIADKFGFGQSKVKSMLMRTRRELKVYLEEAELC